MDLYCQPVQLTEVISELVSALTQSSNASCFRVRLRLGAISCLVRSLLVIECTCVCMSVLYVITIQKSHAACCIINALTQLISLYYIHCICYSCILTERCLLLTYPCSMFNSNAVYGQYYNYILSPVKLAGLLLRLRETSTSLRGKTQGNKQYIKHSLLD